MLLLPKKRRRGFFCQSFWRKTGMPVFAQRHFMLPPSLFSRICGCCSSKRKDASPDCGCGSGEDACMWMERRCIIPQSSSTTCLQLFFAFISLQLRCAALSLSLWISEQETEGERGSKLRRRRGLFAQYLCLGLSSPPSLYKRLNSCHHLLPLPPLSCYVYKYTGGGFINLS